MKNRLSTKYLGALAATAITGIILALLFLMPGAVFSMTVTMAPSKGPGATYKLGETVNFQGQATLITGEIQSFMSANLTITGPQPVSVTLPVVPGTYDLSSQLPQSGGRSVGKLEAVVQYQNLTVSGYGYGYQAGAGGGTVVYDIRYTPPIFLYPQPGFGEKTVTGTYSAQLTVTSSTETKSSTSTAYGITTDLLVTTIYPTGEVSALDRDMVVYQVNAQDPAVTSVVGVGATPPHFYTRAEVHDVLERKWLTTGTYFLPQWIPAGTPAGQVTLPVDLYGPSTVTGTASATIVDSRSKFNVFLMPGANLISFPMLPTSGTKFNLATLLNQTVANANPTFVAGLGHDATLSDVIQSIWYYTGGSTPTWQGYLPGPAADTLTEAGLFQGLWVFTKPEAFTTAGSISVPMKMTLTGRGLEAAQQDIPPTQNIYWAWNLIGLVSERNSTASHMLASLPLPQPPLLAWRNYVDLTQSGSPANPSRVLGRYEGIHNTDPTSAGEGFWLYFSGTSGQLVPVME